MPKKVIKKSKVAKKPLKKKAAIAHVDYSEMKVGKSWYFIVVMFLFVGFSVYSMTMFFSSTNSYLGRFKADVIGSDLRNEDIPEACKACPETPECKPYCQTADETYLIFSDVKSDYPNAEALESLRNVGVIGGFSDGSYKPDEKITRAEALALIANATDADFGGKIYANCFTDVKEEWFAVFVCYGKDKGFLKGYEDGSYKPNDVVNKVEILKVVMTAFGYELPKTVKEQPYSDVEVTAWFAPYVYIAKEQGITSSDSPTFDPSHQMTRAEFAQLIYNVMKDQDLL